MAKECSLDIMLPEKRIHLVSLLRKSGFTARLHAYEYVVGDGEVLIGVFVLRPDNCVLEVFPTPFAELDKIEQVIRVFREVFRIRGINVYGVSV